MTLCSLEGRFSFHDGAKEVSNTYCASTPALVLPSGLELNASSIERYSNNLFHRMRNGNRRIHTHSRPVFLCLPVFSLFSLSCKPYKREVEDLEVESQSVRSSDRRNLKDQDCI